MHTRLATLGLAALLGALAGPPAAAQQAHTVRISDHPVFLDLRVDGAPLRVKVFNGEMARITFQEVTVGLTPKLTPEGANVYLFEIMTEGSGAERIRQVERLSLVVGQPLRFATTLLSLEVTLLDPAALPPLPAGWPGAPGSQPAPASAQATPDGPCSECCVTCDGVKVCACEVWQPCGHCCCSGGLCGACFGPLQ